MLFFANCSNHLEQKDIQNGAYDALNFLGNRQTYPLHEIPNGAYSKAWAQMKRMSSKVSFPNQVGPWETRGPHNRAGRILTLAFNPQNPKTLYAGSASGGLWRSYTAGLGVNTWQRVHIDFPVLGVSTITFNPIDSLVMYIGTGEVYNYNEAGTGAAYRRTRGSFGIGILKSEDGGLTWKKSLDWGQDENHGVWAIRIHPDHPNKIFAATTEGIFVSDDAGANWEKKLNVVMANDIIIHPDNPNLLLATCGNLNSKGSGIYRSTNNGETWSKVNSEYPKFKGKAQLAYAPSDPNIVYGSFGNSLGGDDEATWLCKSVDFGEHWEIVSNIDYSKYQGWYSHDVAVNPNNPDDLVLIGVNIWHSKNGGKNVFSVSIGGAGYSNAPIEGPDGPPNYVHSDAHDVLFYPDDTSSVVYIASDGGIHRSDDGGITFTSCNSGLQTVQFYNGFSNSSKDEKFCIGGLQDNGCIAWNGDKTWQHISGGDGSWTAIDDENFITYTSSQYLHVYRFENGLADNFHQTGIPVIGKVSFIAPFAIAPSDSSIVYAGSSVISKSKYFGNSWNITGDRQYLNTKNTPALSMAISYQNPDIVYTATAPFEQERSEIFRTLNGGDSWEKVTGICPNRYPMDMAVDPTDDAIAYITFAGFGAGHVFRTNDYGETWIDITNGLPDIPTNAVIVDPLFPNNVYIGNDLGVFVSKDYGENWEIFQTGISDAIMVFDLKISPSNRKLRLASHGNGAYERDLLSEPVANKDIVSIFTSMDVYPNPTTDFVNILYNLKSTKKIGIYITNVAGEIQQKILDIKQNKGEHQLKIDLNSLSKGVYFVVLESQGNTISRKVIIN